MPICLEVYNSKGQLVNRLIDDIMDAGIHKVVFTGLDMHKHNIGSGVYYYRLRTPSGTETHKMLLIK
jgi:hypothetical protein